MNVVQLADVFGVCVCVFLPATWSATVAAGRKLLLRSCFPKLNSDDVDDSSGASRQTFGSRLRESLCTIALRSYRSMVEARHKNIRKL